MTEVHAVPNLGALARIAVDFARTLRPGDVVALEGELGAGKTTFVACVVRALGSEADVTSPTFTFWHRYAGPLPLEHLDLYRLDDTAEATELGLEDALDAAGLAFVEWPERLPGFVPRTAIRVRLTGSGDGPRTLVVVRP